MGIKKVTNNIFKYIDIPLLLLCLAVSVMGLLSIFVAFQADDMEKFKDGAMMFKGHYITSQVTTQAVVMLMGFVLVFLMSKVDYTIFTDYWWIIAAISVVLVVLTYFIGLDTGTGADDKAWLMIPIIKKTFQPSELLKIAFTITFSLHLSKVMGHINEIPTLALLCLHGAVPVILIFLQGDDGTALVFMCMFVALMFSAGLRIRYFVGAIIPVIIAGIIYWNILPEFKKLRFLVVLDPYIDPQGIGYHQLQARLAIGNGGLTGVGLFNGGHILLPERHNDFIFSTICETFGLIGAGIVLLLISLMLIRILSIGRKSESPIGRFICIGVFSQIAFQTLINIGMNVGLLPVIGITLPFFSAGGSSVICLYLGIGLVMGVHRSNQLEAGNNRAYVSSRII